MPLRKSRRDFRPRLETLEGRDAPAILTITQEPTFTPNGFARESDGITPFDYGMSWDGHTEIAPNSLTPGLYPGDFTWTGTLELTVQPEAGEVVGTPVHITLSAGGTITWDLDPKDGGGFTTSAVALSAGLEGQPLWFDLSGGQNNAANHDESNDFLSGSGFEEIDTTIGGTIRITVTGSGNSASWAKAPDGTPRGTVFADFGAGYLMSPDLLAGPISFNQNGGVDFQYSVQFQSIIGIQPKAQLFWGDDNGPTGVALYTEDIPLARGTYNRHLNAIAPPPSSATRLWLVLDTADDLPAEQSETNNQSSQAFTNAVVFTGAKYDGDAAPNIVGRFFTGISAPGQFYTVQLTPDLASFVSDAKQVVVKVGNTTLTAMRSDPTPAWDHRTFVTSTHDVGLLTRDTPVTVSVMAGGRVVASATETIDMEPLPAWLANVKPLTKSFDGPTTTYSFSGPLLNLTTLNRTAALSQYGLGGTNRVDVTASMQMSASLDPTRGDLLTFGGSGHARGWYYGRLLFDVTDVFPSPGPFNSNFSAIDPRTLAFPQASVTFNLSSGQNYSDILATPEYAKGNFRIVPHVNANVNYTVSMTAAFGADGRLDPNLSGLDFNFQGLLTGTITPKINLGPTLENALWTLQNTLGTPKNVIDQIRNDLRGKRGAPTVDLAGTVTGELDAAASVKFGGTGLMASTSLRSRHGLLDLVPSVSYTVNWPGGTYLGGVSSMLSKYFTIHTTW